MISPISFCGGETAGSIAKQVNRYNLNARNMAFNESQGETAGSVSKLSFQGNGPKEKSGPSALGVVGTLAAAVVLAVAGLGYLGKTGAINKMKDGKVKDLLKHLTPVTETCHKWCHGVKNKGSEWFNIAKEKCVEWFEQLKNAFKPKG